MKLGFRFFSEEKNTDLFQIGGQVVSQVGVAQAVPERGQSN